MVSLPSLITVVTTAAIDSINPCAIGTLILLVSTVIANVQARSRLLLLGTAYIFAVYLTYLLAGLGLIYFFSLIPIWVAEYIAIVVGLVIVIAGLIELKDYFWYGEGFSLAIPPEMSKKVTQYAQNLSLPGVMFLGAFVAGVELPCTGAPYLAIITLLRQSFTLDALLLLLLYNIIFVSPLLIILALAYFGVKVSDMKMWKHRNRPYMRLATGLLLIALGWLLILIANNTINFA